ncbi:oligosaccharide flippase family protein [Piscinibacter sakaiensis]|uniref:oligosaccharide flippase family protein n=1 Tax=Piscinibacter sakaiensis TaxID=1547922 RepID=UPI003AABA92D
MQNFNKSTSSKRQNAASDPSGDSEDKNAKKMLAKIGWMTFSTLLRLGSGLVLFLILARTLGVADFGTLAYWLAFCTLALMPVNYGFGLYILREAGKSKDHLSIILGDTLVAKLILAAVLSIGMATAAYNWIPDQQLFWLLYGMAMAESFSEYLNYSLRALGRFQEEAKLTLVTALLNFGGVIAFTLALETLPAVATGFLITRIFSLIITWRWIDKYLPIRISTLNLAMPRIRATLRNGFAYAADMALVTLNSTFDILLLSHLAGPSAVGLYQAGLKLMQGATTFAPVLSNVYMPYISERASSGDNIKKTVTELNFKVLSLGAGMGIILAWASGGITAVLFGTEYSEMTTLLPWFALALVLRYLAAGFGINLTAHGHQYIRVVTNVSALAILIVIALLTVPTFGPRGMAFAVASAMGFVALAYYITLIARRIPTGMSSTNVLILSLAALLIVLNIALSN